MSVRTYLQDYEILNSDDHANFGGSPADYRPDVVHQVGVLNMFLHACLAG